MLLNTKTTLSDRQKAQEETKAEILGGSPKLSFSDSTGHPLTEPQDEITAGNMAELTKKRIEAAIARDAAYSMSGGAWVRKHGLSAVIAHAYRGSKHLVDGGVSE